MSKLLAYTIGGQKIGIDITSWNDAILSGNSAFITIVDTGSTPSNYTDISSIINWSQFGEPAGFTYSQVKQEITKLITPTPTPEEIAIFQVWGIYVDTSFISGQTGTFWGDFRVEGKLWVETIRRVKQEAKLAILNINQDEPLGSAQTAGLEIQNVKTTGDSYYLVVDKDGVLKVGFSGQTLQSIANTGGTISTIFSTKATGNITTTSTSDTLMTGMQLTNVPRGTYLLSFGTSMSLSTTANLTTSIYVGGSQVSGSEARFARGSQAVTAEHSISNFVITLTSTQTVEIRWRTSTGTATSNLGRYLTLLKVS